MTTQKAMVISACVIMTAAILAAFTLAAIVSAKGTEPATAAATMNAIPLTLASAMILSLVLCMFSAGIESMRH
jgi:hypothetical protein